MFQNTSHTYILIAFFLLLSFIDSVTSLFSVKFTPSVLGLVFVFILLIIRQFYTSSQTHMGIKIVQTLAINLVTSINPS